MAQLTWQIARNTQQYSKLLTPTYLRHIKTFMQRTLWKLQVMVKNTCYPLDYRWQTFGPLVFQKYEKSRSEIENKIRSQKLALVES